MRDRDFDPVDLRAQQGDAFAQLFNRKRIQGFTDGVMRACGFSWTKVIVVISSHLFCPLLFGHKLPFQANRHIYAKFPS
ncbi:hypothetical protein GGD83_002487 [Rhodoblastus sphagnicola]|nr:hypothetical protein [Rhodoblastus sphagnicola]